MVWVRLDDAMPEHPKILAVGHRAAWLHVCALAYCNRRQTDGFVPKAAVRTLADVPSPDRQAQALVREGLWETEAGGYRIHDFLDYQPSRAQLEADRAQRSEAGRKGADARWRQPDRMAGAIAAPMAGAMADPMRSAWQTDAPYPNPSKEGSNDPSSSEVVNEEGNRLCHLLAGLLTENGVRHSKPNSRRWQQEADRLLRIDKRPVEEAERLIRWCQQDPFWASNILSMPKFREQYDRLRLKAERESQAPKLRAVESSAEFVARGRSA